jgi:hypothetical protein
VALLTTKRLIWKDLIVDAHAKLTGARDGGASFRQRLERLDEPCASEAESIRRALVSYERRHRGRNAAQDGIVALALAAHARRIDLVEHYCGALARREFELNVPAERWELLGEAVLEDLCAWCAEREDRQAQLRDDYRLFKSTGIVLENSPLRYRADVWLPVPGTDEDDPVAGLSLYGLPRLPLWPAEARWFAESIETLLLKGSPAQADMARELIEILALSLGVQRERGHRRGRPEDLGWYWAFRHGVRSLYQHEELAERPQPADLADIACVLMMPKRDGRSRYGGPQGRALKARMLRSDYASPRLFAATPLFSLMLQRRDEANARKSAALRYRMPS